MDHFEMPEEITADEMDTPDILMEATVWVLAEVGYQGLTLRKVAEKAGKNRGLVHYYFESKSDLLACLIEHIRQGTSRLIGIRDNDPVVEKLRTALRFHAYGPGGVDKAGRHYYLAILQLQAFAAHDTTTREKLSKNHRFIQDILVDIIEEGVEDGTFQPVDPESTAVMLLCSIDGARNADLSTNYTNQREIVLNKLEELISMHLVN